MDDRRAATSPSFRRRGPAAFAAALVALLTACSPALVYQPVGLPSNAAPEEVEGAAPAKTASLAPGERPGRERPGGPHPAAHFARLPLRPPPARPATPSTVRAVPHVPLRC